MQFIQPRGEAQQWHAAALEPNWLREAALGIARSNAAILQHAERQGSYVAAARSLWTTRIPPQPPTLSDAQILALLAIHEARLAGEIFAGLAAGIEEEIEQAGIGHEDETLIGWLRADVAGWERHQWRDAADPMGVAEQFLLMAWFAAQAPPAAALQQAEARLA